MKLQSYAPTSGLVLKMIVSTYPIAQKKALGKLGTHTIGRTRLKKMSLCSWNLIFQPLSEKPDKLISSTFLFVRPSCSKAVTKSRQAAGIGFENYFLSDFCQSTISASVVSFWEKILLRSKTSSCLYHSMFFKCSNSFSVNLTFFSAIKF